MKLAIINDNILLTDAMRLSFHFVLAQRLQDRLEAQWWYASRSRHGDFIMIDNGAAEGEMVTNDVLLRVASSVRADEIILPDCLRNVEETLKLSMNQRLLQSVPYTSRVAVPQGADWDEWEYCLQELVKRCRPTTIGVPKWLNELPGGRLKALEILWRGRYHQRYRIHLLGAARGLRKELSELNMPFVRSMDTALPIALAQVGERIDGLSDKRVSVQWDQPVDSRLAEQNIDIALHMAKECIPCTFR